MNTQATPLYKFRLKVKSDFFWQGGYISVFIWKTKKQMLDAAGFKSYAPYAASVREVTPSGNQSWILSVHFWIKELNPNLIGHEIAHSVFEWCRWYNMNVAYHMPDEEYFCYAIGDLERQMYKKLIKLKLFDRIKW